MSHTFEHGKTVFLHNGGFDGDVTIKRPDGELTLPFSDVRALVAEYVRREQIGRLEQANDFELLGISGAECSHESGTRTDSVPLLGGVIRCLACGEVVGRA